MPGEIEVYVADLGIKRLCHFTPSRNLGHIATGEGIESTIQLSKAERKVFNQQDLERLDRHPDHISCSIEYPNAWYYRKKRTGIGRLRPGDRLFKDWVVLLIAPDRLAGPETLFCPRNAAARSGKELMPGIDGLRRLYADPVTGAGGRVFRRLNGHPRAYPTDDQAEVMIHRHIPIAEVEAVVVRDESQAKREYHRLEQLGGQPDRFRFIIAPDFFEPYELSAKVRVGKRPVETVWEPEGSAHA